ncbi:hypothetical protein GJV26_16935 [Massilia dura]|uniref:Uncharacterized protein n=1 Tax=Pseudoduganella dura TaxID=321982 RepID=A0A6I3XBW7_9BURK|nr:hypothetical protein [Pseudoduganella dura]MUI14129.1 hypothetical protein [Pseudoduganella dura]GGX76900.1 hypothetical protein GCM10007386_05130 [Pseudoduganella dura]
MERLLVDFVGPIKLAVEVLHYRSPVLTVDDARRLSILYSDERRWHHRMLNRLLHKLVDFTD